MREVVEAVAGSAPVLLNTGAKAPHERVAYLPRRGRRDRRHATSRSTAAPGTRSTASASAASSPQHATREHARATARGYISWGALTPTRSSERSSTRRAASQSARRERVRRGVGVVEHAALAVEHVEVGRQVARVGDHAVRRSCSTRSRTTSANPARRRISAASSGAGASPGIGRRFVADRSRFAQDGADARVGVLHVVDGVLLTARAREVDVDVDRLVVRALGTRKKRAASTPIASTSSSTQTTLPRRLPMRLPEHGAPSGTAAPRRVRGRSRAPRRAALQPPDVAVVVGAEHVQRAVVAAVELVDDVGEVGGEVGGCCRRSARSRGPCRRRTRSCAARSRRRASNRWPAARARSMRALDGARARAGRPRWSRRPSARGSARASSRMRGHHVSDRRRARTPRGGASGEQRELACASSRDLLARDSRPRAPPRRARVRAATGRSSSIWARSR